MIIVPQLSPTAGMTLIARVVLGFSGVFAIAVSRQAKSTKLEANPSRLAMRTALKFAIVSAIWILLPDLALTELVSNPALIRIWAIAKGWVYVLVMSVVLYAALHGQMRRWAEEMEACKGAEKERQLWADAFENCVQGIVLELPGAEKVLTCNQAFARLLGFTVAELTGVSVLSIYDPADRERAQEFIALADQTGKSQYEICIRKKDGTQVPVQIDLVSVQNGEKTPLYRVATVRDVTEYKRTAEQLRTLSRAVEQCPVSIVITTPQGDIEYVNPHFTRATGYSLEEVRGKNPRVLKSGETSQDVYRGLWETIISGGEWRGEFHNKKKNGDLYWENAAVSPIVDDAGRITHFLAVKEDITRQKLAEQTLQRQASLLEQSYDAVMVWESGGTIIFWNRGAEKLYGYTSSEAVGKAPHLLLETKAQGGLRALRETLEQESRWEGELEHSTRLGRRIKVESRMVLMRESDRTFALAVNRDVTERQKLGDQLRQAQKMEGIGQLAGGIAHDFNNLLGVILGYSEIVLSRNDIGTIRRPVEQIHHAGQRAASLTRQLLAFSRKQLLEPRVINLNSLFGELEKMLRRMIDENIRIEAFLDPTLGQVLADPGQIEQVVMNLVINARDAMPEGGRVTIETANAELDQEYQRQHIGAKPGQYVMMAISDTGTGMDKETQARIFEPFFTTKKDGTGLGLATVYGIVKQSGGYIWVYSELGQGATFKIFLPRIQKEAQEMRPPMPHIQVRGTETILLVEDAEPLRLLTREILEADGYKVLEAPDGEQAIGVSEAYKGDIDLLITDVVMPGMNGPQLAEQLKRIRPRIQVLFISGYPDKAFNHQAILDSGAMLLTKPFTRELLERKLREVLTVG